MNLLPTTDIKSSNNQFNIQLGTNLYIDSYQKNLKT